VSYQIGTSAAPALLNPAAAGTSYANGDHVTVGGITSTVLLDTGFTGSVQTIAGSPMDTGSGHNTSLRFSYSSAASGTKNAGLEIPVTTTGADVLDLVFWVKADADLLTAEKSFQIASLYMTDLRYSLMLWRPNGTGRYNKFWLSIQNAVSPYDTAGPCTAKTMRWSDRTSVTTAVYSTDGILVSGEWNQIRWRSVGWANLPGVITSEVWVNGVKNSFDRAFQGSGAAYETLVSGELSDPVTKIRLGCGFNANSSQADGVFDIGAVSLSLDETDGTMQSDPVVVARPYAGGLSVVTTCVRRALSAVLRWGTSAAALTNEVVMDQVALDASGGRSYTHHGQIPMVQPGTVYYQVVYTDERGTWTGRVYHLSIPTSTESLRVIGYGDTQSYRSQHLVPARAAAKSPDLVIQAGDLTNFCDTTIFATAADYDHADHNRWEWMRNLTSLKPLSAICPVVSIGGNHDWWNDHDANAFYDRIGIAAEITSTSSVGVSYGRITDYGMLRVVGLDVWWADHPDGWAEELAWLRTALNAPDKTWRILVCHYPCFGYPDRGGSFKPLGCRADVQALCEELGVQLVVSGHTNSAHLLDINGTVCHLNVGTPCDGGDRQNIFTLCTADEQPGARTWLNIDTPTGGGAKAAVTYAGPGYWVMDFTANACALEFRAMADDAVVYRTRILQPAGGPVERT